MAQKKTHSLPRRLAVATIIVAALIGGLGCGLLLPVAQSSLQTMQQASQQAQQRQAAMQAQAAQDTAARQSQPPPRLGPEVTTCQPYLENGWRCETR